MKCKLEPGKTEKRFMQKKKKSHSSENMDKKKGKPEQIDKDCGWNYLAKS